MLIWKENYQFTFMIEGRHFKQIAKTTKATIFSFRKGGNQVAIKMVPTNCLKECGHLYNQFMILSQLDHRNIVKALKYQQKISALSNPLNSLRTFKNALVMEYAQKGNLHNYIQKHSLKLPQKRAMMATLASTLHYLHQKGIAHCDLKLANILVFETEDKITLKLADFGFATLWEQNGQPKLFSEYKGTKSYMAPEIHSVNHQGKQKDYEAKPVDIFALGIIFFVLLMGRLPFEYGWLKDGLYSLLAHNKTEEFWAAHQKQIQKLEEEEEGASELFRSLFERMVQEEPRRRPTTEEVMTHPWFSRK